MKEKPNTIKRPGMVLLKGSPVKKLGGWNALTVDARLVWRGITWYRVKGGFSSTGDREDWVADVGGTCVSVSSYHWNGESFGANHGSFDNAMLQESKLAASHAQYHIAKLEADLASKKKGLALLKKSIKKKS